MRRARPTVLALAWGVALLLAACGGDGAPSGGSFVLPGVGNVFANPSFEDGPDPWISLETEAWGKRFEVSDARAHSGSASAYLQMRSEEPGLLSARRYGVVQEVTPERFPDTIAGCYFVERWEQGTPKQYLQLAVIAIGPANFPPGLGEVPNYQLRYVLGGIEQPPFPISNAQFVMIERGPPTIGEWVCFQRNVRQDFLNLWGVVPEGYDFIRVLYEVNWDEREETDGPSIADVYYDDLYFGPAPTAN